jgi:APA family basic amino acid/polyamine antiporter
VVPILGILTCLLLMFSLPVENWWRLFVWMAIGFVIYFMYGYKHSDLRLKLEASVAAAGGSRRP